MSAGYLLSFDYWPLKEWKTTKVKNHSVSAYCLHKLLVYLNFDMFTVAMVIFFSVIFLNICKPRTTFYLLLGACQSGLAFYGKGPAHLPSWLGMMNTGWLSSMRSEVSLQMKYIIFQGCPTKRGASLLGQPAAYNHFLIQLVLLVQNAILHKMLKLEFWNFKPIFLRMHSGMQFSLVATFIFLILVIYSGAAVQRRFWEKVFWNYAANLKKNNHAEVWFQ